MASADYDAFTENQWAVILRGLALSPRQAEIVRCVFLGYGDQQIARELEISVPTVRTHFGRLFDRLGVRDRCELILYIVREYHTACPATCPRQQ